MLDDAVLAMLRGDADDPPLNVHDAIAPADETSKVVTAALPYVVYHSGLPVDQATVLSGDTTSAEVEFELMYVGESPDQARAAGTRAAARIRRKAPLETSGLIRRIGSREVRPERTYTGPGRSQLFYGTDRYAVLL